MGPLLITTNRLKDVASGIYQMENPGNNGATWSSVQTRSNEWQYVDQEKQDSDDARPQSIQSSTISNHQPSKQRRLVSYVSNSNTDQLLERSSTASNERELRTGEMAVEIVIGHECGQGREARSMAHQNAGYDVISEGLDGKRYIEVKGTEAAWGERGVSMTASQFFYARENPDRDHWLYVVDPEKRFPAIV